MRRVPLSATAILVMTLVAMPASAYGAVKRDTTPPELKLPPKASFVLGSTIGPMVPDPDTGGPVATNGIEMRARWSASDPSGICGYSRRKVYAGLPPDPWTPWSQQRSVTTATTDYDDQQGGGSLKFEGYDVRAKDCAGNIARGFVAFLPIVYQENGASYGYGTLPHSYTGSWRTSKCTCWSGGATKYTTARGASASFRFYDPRAGHPIALVMEKAPNRGQAQILIDGFARTTIDTYAATPEHRSVVWVGYVKGGSAHTLTIVNLATAGRPRIDVDAVLFSATGFAG